MVDLGSRDLYSNSTASARRMRAMHACAGRYVVKPLIHLTSVWELSINSHKRNMICVPSSSPPQRSTTIFDACVGGREGRMGNGSAVEHRHTYAASGNMGSICNQLPAWHRRQMQDWRHVLTATRGPQSLNWQRRRTHAAAMLLVLVCVSDVIEIVRIPSRTIVFVSDTTRLDIQRKRQLQQPLVPRTGQHRGVMTTSNSSCPHPAWARFCAATAVIVKVTAEWMNVTNSCFSGGIAQINGKKHHVNFAVE